MNTYIGIDLHRQYFVAHVEDNIGNLLLSKRFENSSSSIEELSNQFPLAEAVVEATRNWQWIVRLLQAKNYQVTMAHPFRTKAIAAAKIKTDSIDARTLCQLLRADLIPMAYIATEQETDNREIARSRINLTHDKTLLKNRIHAILGKFNLNYQGSDLFGISGRRWLNNQSLSTECQTVINSYLKLLNNIEQQIKELDELIDTKSGSNPQVKLLKTIPGIGTTTAFLLASEIGDVNRFPSSKNFTSYLGLVPRLSQSGNHAYYGRITKIGNTYIRWALVQSAHRIIRYQPYWKSKATRLSFRIGKKKAVVATARKLAVVVYAVLKSNTPYQPHQIQNNTTVS